MSNRGATGEVKLSISAVPTNTMVDGQVVSVSISDTILSGRLTSGVGTNQFDRVWMDTSRALSSGVTETLDFYDLGAEDIGGGAGNDPLGQPVVFEELVAVMIRQLSGDGRLEINATVPANNLAWMPAMTVANGGAFRNGMALLFYNPNTDGLDVTDALSHKVNFKANGGDVTYQIYLLGRHDDDESSSSSTSSLSSSSSSSSSSTSSLSSVSSSSSFSSSSSSQSTKSSLSSSSTSSLSSSSSTSSLSSSSSHSISSSSSLSSSSSSSTSTLSSSSSHSISSSSTLSSSSSSSVSSSSSSTSSASSSSSSSSSRLQ